MKPYEIKVKTKLPRNLDRRVKLSNDDIEWIRAERRKGIAIREITRRFNAERHTISRRSIQYTIRPELKEHLAAAFIKRRKDGRYKPEKKEWARVQREHRKYKVGLYNKGILSL